MDFPKKQAQRLMPLYLLEYSEKLFTNHPDPSAPWGGGGGGSDYTAGQGITITNNEISVDTNVIATKADISSMVTTTQLNDALDDYALKTEIPTNVSDLYNDAGYATETWVQNQGYLPSDSLRDVYKAESEISSGQYKVFPHYSGIEYSKDFEDKRLTVKLEDLDNGNHPTIMVSDHERTYIYPGHVDTVSSDNQNSTQMDFSEFRISTDGGMNLTRFRKGGFDYNNIHFNLNSNKQEFENYTLATLDDIPSLDGYATEWWVQNQGYVTSSEIPTNYVTLDTEQTITGLKTIGETSGTISEVDFSGFTFKLSNKAINHPEADIKIRNASYDGYQYPTIYSTKGLYVNLAKIKLGDDGNNTYGIKMPDSSTWEADRVLATTDDIPSLNGYATQTWVENKGYATSSSLATVATSGNYNDLTNKPDFEYHDGDTYVNSGYFTSTGYITNGQKEITFTIILPKLLTNITSVTVNKWQGLLRGVGGYVNGSSDIDYAKASGYTINTYIGAPNAVTIMILKSSAHSNSTNNTPINFSFAVNGLQLTFNE